MNRAKVIGPVSPDLGVDPGDQVLVLPDGVEIGTGLPAQARRQVHRVVLASSSRSRTPGPTRLWPPSRIGIRAVTAAEVSSRSHGSAIRSGSSRSEAKRSSAGGHAASSDPTDGPAGPGCRRWRRRPVWPGTRQGRRDRHVRGACRGGRQEAAGRSGETPRWPSPRSLLHRWIQGEATRRSKAAFLDDGADPGGRRPFEPGQGRGRGPAAHQELGSPVAATARTRANRARSGSRSTPAGPARSPSRISSSGPSMSIASRQRPRRSLTS